MQRRVLSQWVATWAPRIARSLRGDPPIELTLVGLLLLAIAIPAAGQDSPRAAPAEAVEAAIRKELKLTPRELPRFEWEPESPPEDPGGKSLVVLPKLPVGKDRLPALEAAAQQQRTARDAFQLYELFLAHPETTAHEKTAVKPKLKEWQDAAEVGLVRVGRQWMTEEDAREVRRQAEKLSATAVALIGKRDYTNAIESLERATRLNPEHLQSQFLLGVLLYRSDQLTPAERRFTLCRNLAPNSVPVLVNLGVCAIGARKPAIAVRHWASAVDLDPGRSLLAQNLGTFLSDVKTGRLNADKRLVEQASQTYERMLSAKAKPADPSRGYELARELDAPDKQVP